MGWSGIVVGWLAFFGALGRKTRAWGCKFFFGIFFRACLDRVSSKWYFDTQRVVTSYETVLLRTYEGAS